MKTQLRPFYSHLLYFPVLIHNCNCIAKGAITILVFLFLFPTAGISQKWVADTLEVRFGQSVQECSFKIDSVVDLRKNSPNFISIYEQKKWLFFPVDQVVKTSKPLSSSIKAAFKPISVTDTSYQLAIHEFSISNQATSFMRDLKLNATVELFKNNTNSTPQLVGSFYYEVKLSQKKKISITTGYESLLEQWNKKISTDIVNTEQGIDQFMPEKYYHFRRGKHAINKNLYALAELFVGLDFWGIDGQLWFSEPEENRIFSRTSSTIRYVNHPTFQAVAIGRNTKLWNYRFKNNLLFTHKMCFLIGFNNWKDMDTARHKLEEIPLFDLSFTQQINLNPFDKTGWVCGLGLMEDIHYIIYHQPKIKLALAFNLAYKF